MAVIFWCASWRVAGPGSRPYGSNLTARLDGRIQLAGDDIFVTNPTIIAEAIVRGKVAQH